MTTSFLSGDLQASIMSNDDSKASVIHELESKFAEVKGAVAFEASEQRQVANALIDLQQATAEESRASTQKIMAILEAKCTSPTTTPVGSKLLEGMKGLLVKHVTDVRSPPQQQRQQQQSTVQATSNPTFNIVIQTPTQSGGVSLNTPSKHVDAQPPPQHYEEDYPPPVPTLPALKKLTHVQFIALVNSFDAVPSELVQWLQANKINGSKICLRSTWTVLSQEASIKTFQVDYLRSHLVALTEDDITQSLQEQKAETQTEHEKLLGENTALRQQLVEQQETIRALRVQLDEANEGSIALQQLHTEEINALRQQHVEDITRLQREAESRHTAHQSDEAQRRERVKELETQLHRIQCRRPTREETQQIFSAVRGNDLSVLQTLYEQKVNVANGLDEDMDRAPLHVASEKGHLLVCKFLLEHEANVNDVDCYQYTPLHVAATSGQLEVAKLLLEHGANITAAAPLKGGRSITPLECAVQGRHFNVQNYLELKLDADKK